MKCSPNGDGFHPLLQEINAKDAENIYKKRNSQGQQFLNIRFLGGSLSIFILPEKIRHRRGYEQERRVIAFRTLFSTSRPIILRNCYTGTCNVCHILVGLFTIFLFVKILSIFANLHMPLFWECRSLRFLEIVPFVSICICIICKRYSTVPQNWERHSVHKKLPGFMLKIKV